LGSVKNLFIWHHSIFGSKIPAYLCPDDRDDELPSPQQPGKLAGRNENLFWKSIRQGT